MKIKLAFAMGLNDISSLLYELDYTIIPCILENINKLLVRNPLYVETMHLELTLNPPRGGGKKRHKSKRKKSKRKKNTRRK